jgi:hypothetical protein
MALCERPYGHLHHEECHGRSKSVCYLIDDFSRRYSGVFGIEVPPVQTTVASFARGDRSGYEKHTVVVDPYNSGVGAIGGNLTNAQFPILNSYPTANGRRYERFFRIGIRN